MRLRSAGLLSIALCFYFVGAPILDSFCNVVPFAASMDMVIVGLFIGLMPWWEGAAFYLFAAGVNVAQILVGVPYMQAELGALIWAAQGTSGVVASSPAFGYVIPDWIIVGALLGVAATLLGRVVFSLLKSGKTVFLLFFASIIPLFVGGYALLQPIIWDPVLTVDNIGVVTDTGVALMVFFNLYIVFASPFLAYYLFKWLGVYRHIPHIY